MRQPADSGHPSTTIMPIVTNDLSIVCMEDLVNTVMLLGIRKSAGHSRARKGTLSIKKPGCLKEESALNTENAEKRVKRIKSYTS